MMKNAHDRSVAENISNSHQEWVGKIICREKSPSEEDRLIPLGSKWLLFSANENSVLLKRNGELWSLDADVLDDGSWNLAETQFAEMKNWVGKMIYRERPPMFIDEHTILSTVRSKYLLFSIDETTMILEIDGELWAFDTNLLADGYWKLVDN